MEKKSTARKTEQKTEIALTISTREWEVIFQALCTFNVETFNDMLLCDTWKDYEHESKALEEKLWNIYHEHKKEIDRNSTAKEE